MPPLLGDSLLAAPVLIMTLLGAGLWSGCPCPVPPEGVALLVVGAVPLALRRRFPVAVWLLTGLAAAAYGILPYNDPPLPYAALVGVYTVAAHSPRRTAVAAAVVTAVAIVVATVLSGDSGKVDVAFEFLIFATAWLLGDGVRVRRAYTSELEDRAVRLAREREEEARRATAEERVRIARELHDVVAHHVSVISVQSEAARFLLPDHPDKAKEAVEAVGDTARQTLTEMRRLFGALRQDGDARSPLAPQPGLVVLGDLVDSFRQAGLGVELVVEGDGRRLPRGIDLSAYRMVQEALTNVLKHAGPARARVVVRYGDEDLFVSVTDDGRGPDPSGNGRGHGLVGMKERANLFGGELRAGGREEGGFTVEARLPFAGR